MIITGKHQQEHLVHLEESEVLKRLKEHDLQVKNERNANSLRRRSVSVDTWWIKTGYTKLKRKLMQSLTP